MSEWSHLPNARHIDWVIADVRDNPSDWGVARLAAGEAAYGTAGFAAWLAVNGAAQEAWGAAYDAVRDALNAARDIGRAPTLSTETLVRVLREADAWEACLALIAYDHAGKLFDIPVEQVRVLAYLGQPAAVLLLTACLVREKRREMIHE